MTKQNLRLYLKATLRALSLIVSATIKVKGTKGEIHMARYQQVSNVRAKAELDNPTSSGETVRAKVVTVIIM